MAALLVAGLAPAPVLGAVPTVSGGPVTLNEDSSATTITLTATDPDGGFIAGFSISSVPAKGALGAVSDPACGALGEPCTATVVYTPDPDVNGVDSFEFTATDDNAEDGTGTVAITITPVNDEPSFTKGANQGVLEDAGPQTVADWATAISPGPADEITQTVSFSVTNDAISLFSVQPAIASNGTLTYTPAPNANGSAMVSARIVDSDTGANQSATQSFSITISNVNDPPNAVDDAAMVDEDSGSNTIDVLANDEYAPDPPETLTVVDVGAAGKGTAAVGSTGRNVTYIPGLDAAGSDSFSYTISDGSGATDTATVTVTIDTANDPPTAVDDTLTVLEDSGATTVTVLGNDLIAPDIGETLTVTGVTDAPKGTAAIGSTGANVTYTPDQDANGSDSFTYTISDGNGGTDTGTIAITVLPVNDSPSFTRGLDQAVLEDSGPRTVTGWATAISAGPANESSQTLAFEITANSNPTLFSVGPAVDAAGQLTYTPAPDASGPATVSLRITDGGGTASGGIATSGSQSITITVQAVNDAPSFTRGPDVGAPEDAGPQIVTGWAKGVVAGPPDEGSQALTFVVTGNTAPTLFATPPAIDAAGSLTFRPAFNQSGTATITIMLRDDGGTAAGGTDTSATKTFDITVSGANDPPNAGNDVVSVRLGPSVMLSILANDDGGAGEPGDQPRITSVAEGSSPRGFVTISADGRSLVYDPIGCTTGTHYLTYQITDGGGLVSEPATVVVTLLAPSSYPAADGPRPSFVTGTAIGSTVPVKVSWCGITSGTTIEAYRLYQTINDGLYATRIDKTTATSSTGSVSVSPTRHQFQVRLKDRKSRYAYGTGPDFRVGRYQDTSSSIVYSTGWSTSRNTRHSGDSVKGTSTSGRSATFTYTGRGFAIVGPRSSTRGKFKVYADGVLLATVSERASSAQYRRVLCARTLAQGRHTVRIVAAGGGRIDLDAILTLTGY